MKGDTVLMALAFGEIQEWHVLFTDEIRCS